MHLKISDIEFADPNDSVSDEEDLGDEPLEWKISLLIHNDRENTKESILEEINSKFSEKYYELNIDISEFIDNTYLGFSYIIPLEEANQQQKFYCSVFRNINRKGTALLPQESRRSLYFLDADKKDFFDWNGLDTYKISNNNRTRKIDFIRYVSMASQYAKDENINNIMKKYAPRGGKDEEYYANYISEAIGDLKTSMFKPFSENFKEDYHLRLEKLKLTLNQLTLQEKFNSIVETDVVFFGLIYYVLISDKEINIDKKDELKQLIEDKISSYKDFSDEDNKKQEKSPNLLRYIRRRLTDSIAIYKEFLKDED